MKETTTQSIDMCLVYWIEGAFKYYQKMNIPKIKLKPILQSQNRDNVYLNDLPFSIPKGDITQSTVPNCDCVSTQQDYLGDFL